MVSTILSEMYGSIQWLQFTHLKDLKFIPFMRTSLRLLLTIGTTLSREEVLSALEMRLCTIRDTRSEGTFTSMQVSGMWNLTTKLRCLRVKLINRMTLLKGRCGFISWMRSLTLKRCWNMWVKIIRHWVKRDRWLLDVQWVDCHWSFRRNFQLLTESITQRGTSKWLQDCMSKNGWSTGR